jgi:hypothetical protein
MRGKAVAKGLVAGVTTAGVVLATAVTGGAGAGASTMLAYFAYAGGSQVRALNQTIVSDLSAQSAISTFAPGVTSTNTTASVTVSGLLSTNDIATSAASKKTDTADQAIAKAQIGNVNLLNGAITLQAVTTIGQATLTGDTPSGSVNTQFVGLKITGVNLPVNIPKNFNVTIPGVAAVMLNAERIVTGTRIAAAMGAGLIVTLLKPVGQNEQGTTISLAPVYTRVGDVDYENTGHTSFGAAYGSQVLANVGDLVGIHSDPTALISVTPGKTTNSSVAGINLNPALQLGAITDTATGEQTTSRGYAETDSRVAALNLFNGAITADAVQAHAMVNAPTNQPVVVAGYSKLVNLKIGGSPIAVDVAPNTKINVLNFAIVTLNQQFVTANQVVVRAVDIKITTDSFGLKAGTEIQLAVAGARAT